MAFDGNAYRKDVMTRLLADFAPADPVNGDVFFVCAVPTTASDAEVATQLKAVKAFWNKELNHPRYKTVARPLLDNYSAYETLLLDPARRRATAERVSGARGAVNAEAVAELDRLVEKMGARARGIPRTKISALQSAAIRRGLDSDAFKAWLDKQRIVDDAHDGALPWDAPVRRQVRSALEELARSNGDQSRYRTLWTFLLVSPQAGPAATQAAYERLLAENAAGRHDRAKTVVGDLLATVKTRLLVDGGPAAYTASLRADATDSVAGEIEEHGLLSGSLSAVDVAALSARIAALSWGFDAHEGREIVLAAAKSAGVAVEVGGSVDLVVCGACGKPQPAGGNESCRYCHASLYRACPGCSARLESAADVCGSCGLHVRAFDAAVQAGQQAMALISQAEPTAALTLLSQYESMLASTQRPEQFEKVLDTARTTLGTARERWTQVAQDLTGSRYWSAARALTWLSSHAADVPGPDGSTVESWRDRVAAEQTRIQRELRALTAGPVDSREQQLRALLDSAPDSPEVAAAWAKLPLEPAGSVNAVYSSSDGGVLVSWSRSASRDASYRVERLGSDGETKSLGKTSSTSIADGGAPGGVSLVYRVTAVDGDRSSTSVSSEAVFLEKDVAALSSSYDETGRKPAVVLRWPTVPGAGQILVERSDPAGEEPLRRMRPREEGEIRDDLLTPGRTYEYRVFVEYKTDAGRSTTAGARTTVHVPAHPEPVRDIWASTSSDGKTKVSFAAPDAGEVFVLVTDRALPRVSGDRIDMTALVGARVLGPATRRVVDLESRGQVVYTAVTTRDGESVVGSSITHLAVPVPTDLVVVSQTVQDVTVNVTLPTGVTTAYFAWRYDRPSAGPDDRAASGVKVSSGKLMTEGGVTIPFPKDGRGLYIACYPAIAVGGATEPVNAPVRLTVAEPIHAPLAYWIEPSGLLRRHHDLEVRAADGCVLPPFVLRAAGNDEDSKRADAAVVFSYPGGGTSVTEQLNLEAFRGPTVLRLYVAPPVLPIADHPELRARTVRV